MQKIAKLSIQECSSRNLDSIWPDEIRVAQ